MNEIAPHTPVEAGEVAQLGASSVNFISSMTGYARVASRASSSLALTLTLKSINHRFLDLQLRLPAGAEAMEAEVRGELKHALARGHVECTLTLDRGNGRREPGDRRAAVSFDLPLLRAYVANFRSAAMELGLGTEPDLNMVAALPGMLTSDSRPESPAALEAELAREVPALLTEALAALKHMRRHEGASLAAMLRESLARLSLLAREVGTLRAGVQDAHFARLAERLDQLVGRAFDGGGVLSRERLLSEAALLAERGDVEEEVARMHTHIAHFTDLLDGGGEVGKKLDFLLQEMNREANTLLSKTAGTTGGSARITECGLAMKAEIEKLREQVQNIE